MQIGEVIRKYRKEKNLTQEQMAEALGVSAPAVNKWEKGISCPDITMLSPIARLLGIHTDILLSFTNDLSKNEINAIAEKVVKISTTEGLDQAFSYGMDQIYQYPNCDQLLLSLARVLQGICIMGQGSIEESVKDSYMKQIEQIYVRLARSSDANIAATANGSLATYCSIRKEYDKAQEYLDKIPAAGFDKRLMQAGVYRNQNKTEEAYQMYEKYIYSEYMNINMAMQLLLEMYCDDNKFEEAEKIAKMCSSVSDAFGMGEYQSINPLFMLAVKMKDKKKILENAKILVDSIDTMEEVRDSILCEHWKTKETNSKKSGTFILQFKQLLKSAFENDPELAELVNDHEFEKILSKLENTGNN